MPVDMNSQEMQYLLRQYEKGNVVLFAGAGFSLGARNVLGIDPPLASDLARLLAQDCGWSYDGEELATVYAQAEKHLGSKGLHDRLFTYYRGCTPARWHARLAKLFWHRVYTTNIDDVLENAYTAAGAVQRLYPIVCPADYEDPDIWFELLQCVHLHGCVLHPQQGFTFTFEDFASQTAAPSPWHQALVEDMQSKTFLFIGTRLGDAPFYHYLTLRSQRMKGVQEVRAKAFLVVPGLSPIRRRQFEDQNMVVIDSTAQDFLTPVTDALTRQLPTRFELLKNKYPHQIAALTSGLFETQSDLLRQFDLVTVQPTPPARAGYVTAFFDGAEPTWEDIRTGIDAARTMTGEFLKTLRTDTTGVRTFILVGHAGSGKSTMLKRIAYELSRDGKTVYYLKVPERVDKRPLINLLTSIGDRQVYFFFDDANLHMDTVEEISYEFRQANATFVLADRPHIVLPRLSRLRNAKPQTVDMPLLDQTDSESIIHKLQDFGRLGELLGKPRSRQLQEFLRRSRKQLLVAMKEATLGKGFDVILANEFQSLSGYNAQLVYTICCLAYMHRAPVRRRHLIACMEGSDIEKLNTLAQHLRDVVVPWRENSELLCPRHSVIAKQVAIEAAPVDVKTDAIIRYLSQISADITPLNITRRTPEYIGYRGIINLDNMIEILGENYDAIAPIYRELRMYYDNDFLFWLQFGRAELYFDHFPEAENYLKASLSIRDSFQASHHMGVLFLKRAYFSDNRVTALTDLRQGEGILRSQIKVRGETDPYPYAALVQHKLRYLKKHGSASFTSDLEDLLEIANDGLRHHQFDEAMKEAHQQVYKEYLMQAVRGAPAAASQPNLPFGNRGDSNPTFRQ